MTLMRESITLTIIQFLCVFRSQVPLREDAGLKALFAHVDNVPAAGAVVPCPGEALERVVQVPTVQIVVPKVVAAPPDALLDGVALVILEVGIQFFQLEGRLLALGLDPLAVQWRYGRPAPSPSHVREVRRA
ncbi:unnamed protein product, partial [Ixodes hexagonus]